MNILKAMATVIAAIMLLLMIVVIGIVPWLAAFKFLTQGCT